MSSYQPLLPKTSGEFKGGDAAGIWIEEKVNLFNDLGDSLEFDAGSYGEVNSIPSPWSRPLQLISAFRNTNYPNRDWLIAQYRGLLTTLALAENLKLKINATQLKYGWRNFKIMNLPSASGNFALMILIVYYK
jgi:hypothetical protein